MNRLWRQVYDIFRELRPESDNVGVELCAGLNGLFQFVQQTLVKVTHGYIISSIECVREADGYDRLYVPFLLVVWDLVNCMSELVACFRHVSKSA